MRAAGSRRQTEVTETVMAEGVMKSGARGDAQSPEQGRPDLLSASASGISES